MRLNKLPHDIMGLFTAIFVTPMVTIAHLILPMCWYYLKQIWYDLVEKEEDNDV